MSDIPSGLFTEILSLKSLIIPTTSLHLKNYLNFNLILRHNCNLYQLDFPNLTTTIPIKFPLWGDICLLGSCNGLLCISSNLHNIGFWNPNIRNRSYILHTIGDAVGGFAFYQFYDDYKLLRISRCLVMHPQPCTLATLFSFKTSSWKVLPDIQYVISSPETVGVCVENSFLGRD
ncbi:hypothetical protein MTR_3g086970 [Medicago truncatula]|uniref:F-box associated beta-propeller type 1 domain-containing protein n=1 Tax=Medicago truncatula TaxID=3880 RepID=G7J388_MEDTR|nr:hypothetical protein MTR_3g086970 [Medicago truncatula]